jgi:hypothetical protein
MFLDECVPCLQVKSGAQQVLLERIVHELVHSVRRALADVVAATARVTVPEGQWPGLMDFLHQCSRADSAEHREVGLLLFAALFETIGECQLLLLASCLLQATSVAGITCDGIVHALSAHF